MQDSLLSAGIPSARVFIVLPGDSPGFAALRVFHFDSLHFCGYPPGVRGIRCTSGGILQNGEFLTLT